MNIGDHAYGGIITYFFEVWEKGYVEGEEHGIVVSDEDIGQSKWGCYSFMDATGLTIGCGGINTMNIIKNCSNDSAAKLCVNYSGGGYTDWVLPSLFEFKTFYDLHWSGLCNFTTGETIDDINGRYYTSSEVSPFFGGMYYSYSFAFSRSINYLSNISEENPDWWMFGGVDKSYIYNVRAIRYF